MFLGKFQLELTRTGLKGQLFLRHSWICVPVPPGPAPSPGRLPEASCADWFPGPSACGRPVPWLPRGSTVSTTQLA